MTTQTAEHRRAAAKVAYDAYLATCPSRQLLDRISDKWVTLTICALGEGPQRYSDLSRNMAGVSPKMLTQTLRKIERDGLVTRTLTPSVPVRVDYELTPLGHNLHVLVLQFKQWAELHMEHVVAAREIYDASARS